MTDAILIGLLSLAGTLIGVITPIIKLNSNITTLNCNLEALSNTIRRDEDELDKVKKSISQHDREIGDVKKDVKFLYKKTEDLENRKE